MTESSTSTLTDDKSQSTTKPTLSPSPSTTLSTSIFITSPVVWARTPFKTLSIASPSVTPSLSASPSNSSLRGGEAFVTRYTQTSASSSSSPSMLPILYTTTTIPITIYVTRSHTKHKNSDHNTRIPKQTATPSSSQAVVAFPTRSVVHPPHRPPPPFRDRTSSFPMTITTSQPDNPSNNTTPAPAAVSTPTSDAAGVSVTAVTGVAAIVSAAASTGASIALLSSLGSCDDERPKDTVMVYVLSPFYSLGAVAIALGNVGLAMAFC